MTDAPSSARRPLFIGSEIYRRSSYGSKHPLSIPRVSTVIDLARSLGWLPDAVYIDSPMASPEQLARFHDPDYIAAVRRAAAAGEADAESRARYNIGTVENPVFPEIFSRPATASGGSILAATLLADAPGIVHSPAGGTHHGRPDRASGFCYFNDPVLGILTLLDRDIAPVFYIDLDAHHGDGVEDAFAGDERVTTLSIHEEGRWPRTGETGQGAGPNTFNIAVPRDLNDSEHAAILDGAALPLIQARRPAAIVVQAGADSLAEDPLSRLSLSNRALFSAVAKIKTLSDRLLVLGGGGYNPWTLARAWTGIWGVLNGIDPPDTLPPEAERVLRALTWDRAAGREPPERWMTTLADTPNEGPVRPEVRAGIARLRAATARHSD